MPLDQSILGKGVYTPREAARLIGLPHQKVMRWTRGSGSSEPLWDAYFQFVHDSTEISFLDLVEVRVVHAMRNSGISMQAIRFAIRFAEERFEIERPLASKRFLTDGKTILMDAVEADGEYVELSKRNAGQKVFRDIVDQSLTDLEFEAGQPVRWRPKRHKDVVIDPARNFGDPLLDAYGISTRMISSEYELFKDIGYLSRVYELPQRVVKRAVDFEKTLDANGQSTF